MTGWLLQLLVNSVILLFIAHFFTRVDIESFGAALLASFILALVNLLVKPILVVLTLPITFLTLGLFIFIINALMLQLTSTLMGSEFVIDGFGMAIVAAIVMALLNTMIHTLMLKPR
ncbi:phage holin family protein [Texcoconibacillus texcoconensis]|uniref:Putative membrane protein n=1 Tax=Texcoconibacillus texcoconensis TaxID=1095777 RepID=A0A840QPY1_9BACI|nr:phage holin family protein [Texcoconibacillus texcoconensis]MBB5173434.1 putative membrane protein [Texcoconibacillus texcoconensis]